MTPRKFGSLGHSASPGAIVIRCVCLFVMVVCLFVHGACCDFAKSRSPIFMKFGTDV